MNIGRSRVLQGNARLGFLSSESEQHLPPKSERRVPIPSLAEDGSQRAPLANLVRGA